MANIAGIMELYTAYFNRAADKDGVDYWAKEMDTKGWTLDDVANTFAQQDEYDALYAEKTNAEIVALVYKNVLNRDADADGAAYWLAELDSGAVTVSQLIQAVVNAATEMVDGAYKHATDAAIVNNKTAVSQHAYDTNSNVKTVSLDKVTADAASIDAAKAAVDAAKAADGDTGTLTESLATLAAAKTEKADWLKSLDKIDSDLNPATDAVKADDASIKAYYAKATDNITGLEFETGLKDFADKSVTLQDTAVAEKLGDYKDALAKAKAAAATGMTSLLEDVAEAEKDLTAKSDAVFAADKVLKGKEAEFKAINDAVSAYSSTTNTLGVVTFAADGSTDLLAANYALTKVNSTTGVVSLRDAVADAGLTKGSKAAAEFEAVQAKLADFITAYNAKVAAESVLETAKEALDEAAQAVVLAENDAYSIFDKGSLVNYSGVNGTSEGLKAIVDFTVSDVKYYKTKAKEDAAVKQSIELSMDRAPITGESLTLKINGTAYTQAFDTNAATTYAKLKQKVEAAQPVTVTVNPNGDDANEILIEANVAGVAFTDAAASDYTNTVTANAGTTVANVAAVKQSIELSMDRAPVASDSLKLTINGNDYTQAFDTTAAKTYAELKAKVEAVEPVTVTVNPNGNNANEIKIEANVAGVAFTDATASDYSNDNGSATITVVVTAGTTVPNVAAVKQSIELSMDRAPVTGDSLTLTINGTTYTQLFDTDAATTYANLKQLVELLEPVKVTVNPNGNDANEIKIEANVAGVPFTGATASDYTNTVVVTASNTVPNSDTSDSVLNAAPLADTLKTKIEDLADYEELVAAFEDARDLRAELKTLTDAITAADKAIQNPTDDKDAPGLGIKLIDIDGSTKAATTKDDIFLLGEISSSISNFSTTDSIFVGTDFTLVVAAKDAKISDSLGDVSVLEAIVLDDGTDTTIYFEEKTFAGSSSSDKDMIKITLSGVTDQEVSIDANGFLTIA